MDQYTAEKIALKAFKEGLRLEDLRRLQYASAMLCESEEDIQAFIEYIESSSGADN